MKNITHSARFALAGLAAILLVAVGANTAFAATSFNNDPQDFATLRVKNNTENPGNTVGWAATANADAGEVVSFAIYYHNTGSETAQNVRVRLTPQTTANASVHAFTAYLLADNASQISGSATVYLSTAQVTSFQSGSVLWFPNQTTSGPSPLPSGQSGSEIFNASGLSIGNIATGWSTQGSVVLSFTVGNTTPPPTNIPSATTNAATSVTQNSATLNCYVNPNSTSNTTRWFEWGTNSTSLSNSTTHQNQGTSAGSFNDTVSGLSSNTNYYFRCVAQNSAGIVYGSVLSFFTSYGGGGGQLPSVTTYSPTNTSGSFAILNGYVNPNSTSDTTRWFEWGTQSYSLNYSTTKIGQGTSAGNFNDTISGLSYNTTYYYRAVAQNSYGTVYGGVQSFVTTDGGGGNQSPFVSTNSATGVSGSYATLNCYVNPYNTSGTTRWFEWGTTQSLGNRTITLSHGSTATNAQETVSGLAPNTTYYFRCAAQNSYGTGYGSILSFYTGSGTTGAPTAVTNLATNIDSTTARLNGLGLNLGSLVTSDGWFEWGTTQNLGNTTTRIPLGLVSSNTFYATLAALSPNTTYYFRAVVQNSNGTGYGDILNFRTNSTYVPPAPPGPTPVAPAKDASIFKRVTNLTNANGTDTDVSLKRGETARYTIEVRNTGTATLKNASIKDRIPHYIEFANAEERARVDGTQREVVWFLGDFLPGDSRIVSLDVILTDDVPFSTTIENVARLEADNFTRNSNTAIIRATDINSNAAAAAFFGGGFLPNTFVGWLLLTILILILVILARKAYGSFEDGRRPEGGMSAH